jgi:hypothetical protein
MKASIITFRADQFLQLRPVAKLDDLGNDLGAETLHEAEALVAKRADFDLFAFGLPALVLVQHHPQQVGVKGPAEALVGGDDDQA